MRQRTEGPCFSLGPLSDFLAEFQKRLMRDRSHGRVNPRREGACHSKMPRRPRPSLIASLLVAACIGVGGGALLSWALLSDHKTVTRQVTVENAQTAASATPLSVNE